MLRQPYNNSRPTTTQTENTMDSSLASEYSDINMHAENFRRGFRGNEGTAYSDEEEWFSSRPSSRGDQNSIASTSRLSIEEW